MLHPKMTIVPEVVREVAEQAFEQTEKAFDAFFCAANKSVAMFPSPAADMSTKTLVLTERVRCRPKCGAAFRANCRLAIDSSGLLPLLLQKFEVIVLGG